MRGDATGSGELLLPGPEGDELVSQREFRCEVVHGEGMNSLSAGAAMSWARVDLACTGIILAL